MSALDGATAACHAVMREHAKSFSIAARLLPRAVQDDVVALYAFCRRADDAVDEVPPTAGPAALARLRDELDAVYSGAPQTEAALVAFQRLVVRRRIPRAYPSALLDGMEMDVVGFRYRTRAELRLYCYRVASTVGLMMCHVLGIRDDDALANAAHLGIAMQLTNICRDVAEDADRGRVYLPDEVLGATLGDGRAPTSDERRRVRLAVRALLDEAEEHYRSADRGLAALPFQASLAVRAARLLYAAIGDELAKNGFDPYRGRAIVPRAKKALLLSRTFAFAVRSLPGRIRDRREYVAPRAIVREDEIPPPRGR